MRHVGVPECMQVFLDANMVRTSAQFAVTAQNKEAVNHDLIVPSGTRTFSFGEEVAIKTAWIACRAALTIVTIVTSPSSFAIVSEMSVGSEARLR